MSLIAQDTTTMLHAEPTIAERNILTITATLTDEDGNVLTDQDGETLTAYGETPVIVLHAVDTSSLYHAEDQWHAT